MPELPEVETTVRDLNKNILGGTIIGVWTDFKKTIKKPKSFNNFKNQLKRKKILNVWRRGKNIIIELSGGLALLIHLKMTGHFLYGKWQLKNGKWEARSPGALRDPMNRFLHIVFFLDKGKMLALSDLRKFAKVELWESNQLKKSNIFKSLGPDPLEKTFTFKKFKEIIHQARGKIKQVLMNQNVVSGIGNIYSDEILWKAKVHPFKAVSNLSDGELKKIYSAMKKILLLAIKLGGESFSDFRRLSGEKGYYNKARKVYGKEGEKCPVCGGIIKRMKIGGRSAHFCPKCQKL